ncbi:MAG: chitobiase/beta-hexosaminidase C-terminal domain-containing protein [Lachnospiraceae bacterium]|nr:chitobiase/beta-hexosaminidase C-terminal domain-containing protein [Lachnospiraceae bacterium]
MRKRNQMKKGIAALLSSVLAFGMTAGVIPEFGDSMRSVRAATGKPSVTAYATKQQMMDGTFAPSNSSGTAANVGVLAFGKNRAKKTQEWYILGKDKYVDGENTVIFTVQDGIIPLTIQNNAQKYSTTTNDRPYKDSYGTYTTANAPTTVPCNHYGASTLRAELNKIASDTACFSTAQQKLLNTTTIKTTYRLDRMDYTYTNSDKLYAPVFNHSYKQILRIGSKDQIRISTRVYWDSQNPTWTRSAVENYGRDHVYAVSRTLNSTCYIPGQLVKACCAASNLNLTDVLFASSAEAATSDTAVSGEIAQGKAMTLRLNGGGKDIGTVTCNADVGQINAKKGNTTGNVALVVQGNDGTKDWYYSKQISGTENVIVNASDIAAESNTPSDIDLTNCKIWLEVTDDSVAYAVEATATKDVVKTNISSVEITDIDTPVSNTALDTSAVCATQGVSTTAPAVTWTPNDTNAGYNTSYTASVTLAASANYEFTDSVIVTINGHNAHVTKHEDGTLTAIYEFPATAKDKLTRITAPGAITVANGTAYYKDMNLPTQVNIVTEGNTVDKADVTWDTVSGKYDPSALEEQVVTLNGRVICPENIDANGVELTTRITITVSAAGIVGAPTPSVESGTYTENQKVALESSTEGATIYYTTDGAEPGRTTGTRYTGPITVPGTEGQSITTTLKAIAVKDGMQDSEVKTFTYTINIPKPIVKHTITATAGANGSISPSGNVEVVEGADQTFTITANEGYEIESLKVDGAAVSTATSYTFPNVRAAHTIEATFKQKITVEKPSIGKQPQNVSVKAGEQATFTVAATGTDLKYQWQIDRNDGKGFADIAGADRASYTTSAVDKNCNGYKYQCVISNSAGSVTTGTATLTVTEDVTPPVQPTVKKPGISKQPQNVSVKAGEQATFTVKATGTDLTYQWQINRNNGKGFVDITGADKASYTTGVADMLCNGYKYQCVISNSAGSVTTNAATLTVTESTTPSPDPVSYKILDGANSSWTENTDGSLTIRGNGEMEKFQNVKVDGKIIDKKNYTVTKGSTIITLKADYLKTLATGDHTFEIVWTDGSATTKFAVAKNKSGDNNKNNNNNNKKNNSNNAKNNQTTQNNPTDTKKKEQSVTAPKTGDTSDMTLWTTLLIVSFAGAAGIVVRRNNKTCK